jgi:hypothetical protein
MPAPRRRVYRDEIPRISIADLRRNFGPAWRSMSSVSLKVDGAVTVVELVGLPSSTAYGGTKRWLLCANCFRRAMVLGLVRGSWRCTSCGNWVGRDTNRYARPSSSAEESASAAM